MFKNKLVMIMWLSVFSLKLMGQNVVTGKVTSVDEGTSIPGVSILIKGTTKGVVTNSDGNYSIDASAEDILIFSFLGYKSQERAVRSTSVIDIQMETDVSQLDEIVLVGYGTQQKSDVTGAVVSVKAETLRELPLARADQALQGRVAGLTIQNSTAEPNAKVVARIRGANSITGGNNPLIVIDGVQGGSLNNVHPGDILNMEVLKDASATAIYGSKGANGVIIVTTVEGKSSAPKFSYSTYLTSHTVRKKRDLLNAGQYAQAVNDNDIESARTPTFTSAEVADFVSNGGTDWQDEIFRTGFSHNHHINVNGGSDNVQYNISGDYLNNKGIVLNSDYERYSIRPNISIKLRDNLKVRLNSFAQWSTNHPAVINGRDTSPIFSASIWAPTKPIFEADGSYSQPGGGVGPNTDFNPVALALEPIRNNLSNVISVNPSIEYEIINGLTITVRGAYRITDNENSFYDNYLPRGGNPASRTASITNNRSTFFQNTNLVTYEKTFDTHSIKLTGVYETQIERFNGSSITGKGFLTDNVTFNNLGLAENLNASSNISRKDLESFMGRVNYSYADKYVVTLTGRSDGSSIFGENEKRGFFQSAGFSWNLHNESFLSSLSSISYLKFRAGYGEVGSQASGPYNSLAQLATGQNFSFDGTSRTVGVSLADRASNPDFKWESTKQTNIGVDLELFDGRLTFNADYYKKNTENLILQIPLAQSSGFSSKLINVGEVENKGFDISIGVTPIDGDFSWNTNLVLSSNDNKVLALAEGQTEQLLGSAGLPNFPTTVWLEVGQPLGLFRGLVQDGVWTTAEATQAAEVGAFPGAPKFIDQNDDGVIGDDDIVNIGNAQADYTFGWNNTLKYANFDLNLFIQGVQGNDIYNLSRVRTDRSSGDSDATSTAILDRWSTSNENTDVPSFAGSNAFPQLNSSRWLEDGSYIRFRNISLGYTFPDTVLEKLGIGTLRIYLSGTNLITITDYSGYDPEARTGEDERGGIDLATYPSQKTYTFGLNVTF